MKVIGAIVLVVGGLALLIPLSTIFGALAGWLIGWLFPDMMRHLCALLHVTAPYQAGALLGFVGGFFRSNLSSKNK